MEIWDGYNRDGSLAGIDLVRGEKLPQGVYHLVCDVIVRNTDGDYLLMQRDFRKKKYGGEFEAGAGGAALKGEDKWACVKRELREETGIECEEFVEVGVDINDKNQCIFYLFVCTTDCDKDAITLQEGETIDYKWISEAEFIKLVNSGEMIAGQRRRYAEYFEKIGYIK